MTVACINYDQDGNLDILNQNKNWPNPPAAPIELRYIKKTPQIIERADTLCTPEKAIDDLGRMQVWLFKKSKMVLTEVDLTGVSGKDLSSIVSTGAYYNFKHLVDYEDCTAKGNSKYTCNKSSVKEEKSASPVSICREKGAYPAKSIENAALAGMAGLMQAYKSIKASTINVNIPKVELLIHPIFKSRITTKQETLVTFMTDNAFWTNSSRRGQINTIALLPHSEEYKVLFQNAPLWAQSGVISHEYGHHALHYLAPNLFTSAQTSNLKRDFEAVLEDLTAKAFGKKNRTVSTREVVSSLNEGYADLIAHYTHDSGNNPWGTVVIGSFQKSRNAGSCDCDDGEVKSINRSVIKHFFSPHESKPHSYLSVNHQDVHTVGAIIAHGIDSILSLQKKTDGTKLTSIEKMNWLIKWAKKLNKDFTQKDEVSPSMLLEEFMYHGVKHLDEMEKPFSEEQCHIIKRVFPVYAQKWQHNKKDFSCSYD